jgi:hypothetical protein
MKTGRCAAIALRRKQIHPNQQPLTEEGKTQTDHRAKTTYNEGGAPKGKENKG